MKTAHIADFGHILKNSKVHIISVTEPIFSTPEGIMLEGMAEYYSAELAEKWPVGSKKTH